jgi:stress-induced morphogen
MPGLRGTRTERNLLAAFSPTQLQVLNESHMHSGPATE